VPLRRIGYKSDLTINYITCLLYMQIQRYNTSSEKARKYISQRRPHQDENDSSWTLHKVQGKLHAPLLSIQRHAMSCNLTSYLSQAISIYFIRFKI
jgi:hypothetical protein